MTMESNTVRDQALGGSPPFIWQQHAVIRSLSLVFIHIQLRMIHIFIDQHEDGPDDMDPQTIRVITHHITTLGQRLDNIEARATEDARAGAIGNDENVA
ncbi:hypothetical protein PG996_015150 [Apiospora saccharicola]|uniref:Uncharacterized protein n=1 Tax=Apiospora saccharicola TaxID=335842 RepID=A0ABR1TKA9_9PEZI